jgi:ribosomal subunit interface protein
MNPKITMRHIKVSDRTKEHIERACAKLTQFYDRIIDCEVVLEKEKLGTKVEFIVAVPHQTLVASSHTEEENLFKALDEAHERVEVQLKKYHDRQVEHRPSAPESQ